MRRLLQFSLGFRSARDRGPAQDHATRLAHGLHHMCLDLVANLDRQIAILVAQLLQIDHAFAVAARQFHEGGFAAQRNNAATHRIAHPHVALGPASVLALELLQKCGEIFFLRWLHYPLHTITQASMPAQRAWTTRASAGLRKEVCPYRRGTL